MAKLVLTEEEKEERSYLNWDDETLGKAVKKKAIEFEDYYGEQATEREAALVSLISKVIEEHQNDLVMMEVGGIRKNGEDLGKWRITFEKVDSDLPGGPPMEPPEDDEGPDDEEGEGGVLVP